MSESEQAGSVSRAAFRAARTVAASMEAAETGGVFVTVQDTGGCFGLKDPDPQRAWLGGLAALTQDRGQGVAAGRGQGHRISARRPR